MLHGAGARRGGADCCCPLLHSFSSLPPVGKKPFSWERIEGDHGYAIGWGMSSQSKVGCKAGWIYADMCQVETLDHG